MNIEELKPLPIVDDRTLEQIRENGDERWPSGEPYILRGACCVCEKPAPDPRLHTCLVKLAAPCECETHLLVQEPQCCTGLAYWASGYDRLTAVCDECIRQMAGMNSDNEQWLAEALADIAARTNLARFFEAVTQRVETFDTPLFYENDGESIGWFSDERIPAGWGIEVRKHNEFYAYQSDGPIDMSYIPDSKGFDQVYETYEDALAAIVAENQVV